MARGSNVTTYLNAEEIEALDAQVEKEGIPQNQILKKAFREYIERQAKNHE